jgi:hypothetical protein
VPTSSRLPTRPRRVARPGLDYPRENLEQSGLAGAVSADDADDVARVDVEADVLEGPYGLARGALSDLRLERAAQDVDDVVAERAISGLGLVADDIGLGQTVDLDDRRHM